MCCFRLTLRSRTSASVSMQVLDSMHLRALSQLPRLRVLNLYFLHWAEAVVSTGLTLLAAHLPRLRVLNAPRNVLVCHHRLKDCIQMPRTDSISYIPYLQCYTSNNMRSGCVASTSSHAYDTLFGSCKSSYCSLRTLCSFRQPQISYITAEPGGDAAYLMLRWCQQAQHHAVSAEAPWHDAVCGYELRDPPGRRLRRWPRRAFLDKAAEDHPAE